MSTQPEKRHVASQAVAADTHNNPMLNYYNSRLKMCLAERDRYDEEKIKPNENYYALMEEISGLQKKIAVEKAKGETRSATDTLENTPIATHDLARLPSQNTLRDPDVPSPDELSSPFSADLLRDIRILSADNQRNAEEQEGDGGDDDSGNTPSLQDNPHTA